MKNNKKLKIGKLNFYIIDDNYIEYLSQFDKHIAYNKNEKRPYICVLLIVENHYYFAPLFSPKQKQYLFKVPLYYLTIFITYTNQLNYFSSSMAPLHFLMYLIIYHFLGLMYTT